MAERRLEIRVAQTRQAFLRRFARGDQREALLKVAVVGLKMCRHQPVQKLASGAAQVAAGFEMIGQPASFVERPGLKGGDKLNLIDESVLKGEQSEQQMSVRGAGHRESPGHSVRRPSGLQMTATKPTSRGTFRTRDYPRSMRTVHSLLDRLSSWRRGHRAHAD